MSFCIQCQLTWNSDLLEKTRDLQCGDHQREWELWSIGAGLGEWPTKVVHMVILKAPNLDYSFCTYLCNLWAPDHSSGSWQRIYKIYKVWLKEGMGCSIQGRNLCQWNTEEYEHTGVGVGDSQALVRRQRNWLLQTQVHLLICKRPS